MTKRTTVVIEEELLAAVKEFAADKGWSLSKAVAELVKIGMNRPKEAENYAFTWRTFRGKTAPGLDIDDRDKLYDMMEGEK